MADGCNQVIVAPSPTDSLSLKVQVTKGYKQIQRSLAQYTVSYLAQTRTSSDDVVLAPAATFTGPAATALIVQTTAPISITLTKADATTVVLAVNKFLAVDQPVTGYVITNTGMGEAHVEINAALS